MTIGAVTVLSPDEHITGIWTVREIEYAAASAGVAYIHQIKCKQFESQIEQCLQLQTLQNGFKEVC